MLAGGFGEKLQKRRRPTMVSLSIELKQHETGVLYYLAMHCTL